MNDIDSLDLEELLKTVPLFENIKKSDMKKLLDPKHHAFKHPGAGDVIVRQGELDTEFFVVLDGIASAYRTDDGDTRLVASYGAGDFFGEMSAISHQPRSATVKADSPCVLLMLDVTLFQLMFNDKKSSFTALIDERYRERALAFHLTTAPIFASTAPADLKQVAERAELVSFAKDEVLAKEGDPADAVYLVRSGIVKRTKHVSTGEDVVHDYLCDNSSFGENSLSEENEWLWTCTAMSHVDLVKLPKAVFTEVLSKQARETISRRVGLLMAEEQGTHTALSDTDHFELMVGRETVKGREALVIDLKKCTRCNACVESCVAVHEDRVPRLSKRGIRDGDLMLSSACYNCKIPECMLSCKFGAIRRDVDGQIHIVLDNCVGCNKCESHCPYGVIRMAHLLTPEEREAQKEEESIWQSIPLLNKVYEFNKKRKAPEESGDGDTKKKDKAKAIKCDLCSGLPFEACVYNCPCSAISRQDPTALRGIGTITASL